MNGGQSRRREWTNDMIDRWEKGPRKGEDALADLVYGSRLIGEEESLVLWGGGNTSLKLTESDHLNRPLEVLRIKGSGSDLKTCEHKDFAGVRLAEALSVYARETMTDDEMVEFLSHCLMEPRGPRPSIETLLHAFLPARAIVHSHADAILALVDTPDPLALIAPLLGDQLVVVPYLRPGFDMAKSAAEVAKDHPPAEGMILLHHGLVTWGDTVELAYRRHIAIVSTAASFLAEKARTHWVAPRSRWAAAEREQLQITLAPIVRRALSGDRPQVLAFTDEKAVLEFVEREDVVALSQVGVATPDHILHTKRVPVVIPAEPGMSVDQLETLVDDRIARYMAEYQTYFERYQSPGLPMRDPRPIIALVPRMGVWAVGADARLARVPLDIYRHTAEIIALAEAAGGYRSISEAEAFNVEYWPLELYKLTLRAPSRELTGRVAFITGGARGIGAAIARRFAQAGAVVVIADRLGEAAQATAKELTDRHGPHSAVAVPLDVTREKDVIEAVSAVVRQVGGIDILVSNAGTAPTGTLVDLTTEAWEAAVKVNITGHFLVTREVLKVMTRQKLGGSVVYIVSKNALVPGPEFGAYSVAKAAEAQLGRIVAVEYGRYGIRANMINPDAIWTDLWSPKVRSDRAQAYHVAESELEEFYKNRSLLKRKVTVEDVAETALFFASDRSNKTTGAILPVDGGIREGFPR